MEEELISLKTAKLAKEKGFDMKSGFAFCIENNKVEETLYCYTKEEKHLYVARPTQGLLQKWLREKHDITLYIDYREHHVCLYHIITDNDELLGNKTTNYEEALEQGLIKALKLIK